MSNPTLAKPSASVFSAAATLGPNCQCLIALTEGKGAPADLVNHIAARRSAGIGYPKGFGPSQVWVPNGFNSSYTLKSGYGCPALSFDGSGFTTSYATGGKTFGCVFKHNMPPPNNSTWSNVSQSVGVFGAGGDTTFNGIALDPYNRLFLARGNTYGGALQFGVPGRPNGLITLIPNRWYAVMIGVDDTTGALTRTRWAWVYDYLAQAEHIYSNYGGAYDTVSMTSTGIQGTATPLVNSPTLFPSFGSAGQDFIGEVYSAALWSSLLTHADFVNFYQDPVSAARGTSPNAAGNLSVYVPRISDVSTTTIGVTAATPTGTGQGGGAGTADLELWASKSAFVAGVGGARIDNLAGVTKTVTGSTIHFDDARPALAYGDIWLYAVLAKDAGSAETVPSVAIAAGLARAARPGALGLMGTSLSMKSLDTANNAFFMAGALASYGYRMGVCDRGGFGSRASDWFTGAVTNLASQVWSLAWTNGTATASTAIALTGIDPTVGGGTPFTTANLAFNSTAAQVQTAMNNALSGIGSTGTVTCGGGPWPAAAITCTATGGWVNTTIPSGLSVAPGYAVTGTGPTIPGAPPFLNCYPTTYGLGANIWTTAVAEWTKAGVSDFHLEILINEAQNSVTPATATTNITTLLNQLLTTFPSLSTITLSDGGCTFSLPPANLQLVATGGTGSGFLGHVVVGTSSAITSVVVDAPGSYTVAPTLSLTGVTGASGATFTAVLGGGGVASVTVGGAGGLGYGAITTLQDFLNQYRATGVLAAAAAACSSPSRVKVGTWSATAAHYNNPDLTNDGAHPAGVGVAVENGIWVRNLIDTWEPPAAGGGNFASGLKSGGRL
jgi:hypothetical protein